MESGFIESERFTGMFGSIGGVFSRSDLELLRTVPDFRCFVVIDLGRRLRIDEVEMLPRKRFSEISELDFIILERERGPIERERERAQFKCW